jgi:hypothetical protein
MTFKTNAILAAALMAAFAAQAGTLTPAVAGGTVFAAEAFQGATATDTNTAITPGAITYSVATTGGIVVNAGGSIYYYVRLSNGKFATAPQATAVTGSVPTLLGTGSVTVVGISADKTTALVKLTNTTASTVNIGVGGTIIYTPATGAIDTVKTALATAGGTVSATGSLSALAAATAPDATAAQPSDVDGAPANAVIAKSAQAISAAVSNLPTNTVKIDLSATPPASAYTPTTYAQLGSVTFTQFAAANPDRAANLTIALANAGGFATVVATPGAGQSFPVGATLKVGDNNCVNLATPSSTKTFTALNASAAASLTVPVASIASGTPLYLCLSAPGAGQTATPITANITAELLNNVVVATAGKTSAAGAGYALGYNGTQIDVTNYVPAAVTGWTQFIRVANTGALSAPVSAAFVNEATGAVGTSAVVIPSLAAGAVKNLTASDIEAALGAQADSARPRLRITAPSNALTVQNMLFTPNGSFTNNSAQQQ